MRITLTILLLVPTAVLLGAPAPAGAEQALPHRVVINDGADGSPDMHVLLDRVVATSATKKSRQAKVKAEFSESLSEGDGFAVWFNLDRDNMPEVLTYHVAGNLYFEAFTMSSWTATKKDISGRCFKVRSAGAAASVVRFNPHCFGHTSSFQVSVGLYSTVGDGMLADFAPEKHVWSRRIAANG